jgi:hypothetical protein
VTSKSPKKNHRFYLDLILNKMQYKMIERFWQTSFAKIDIQCTFFSIGMSLHLTARRIAYFSTVASLQPTVKTVS